MLVVAFEGIDGSGKTTIAKAFQALLQLSGDLIFTKEPGSPLVPSCQKIREIILNEDLSETALSYLFAADTYQHLEEIVKPEVAQGNIVISDRCVVSDYAYRPHVGGSYRRANRNTFLSIPHLVFFINTSPKICKQRLNNRGKELNNFEKKYVVNNLEQLQKTYVHVFQTMKGLNYITIANDGTVAEVMVKIFEEYNRVIPT